VRLLMTGARGRHKPSACSRKVGGGFRKRSRGDDGL